MNLVSGKITHKESGLGIPNLIATLYDIDTVLLPKDLRSFAQEVTVGKIALSAHDRLGSALTNNDGSFTIQYEDDVLKYSNEKAKAIRPHLALVVFVPETQGRKSYENILFVTDDIRSNAGKAEIFLVKITTKALTQLSVPIPAPIKASPDETSEDKVRAYLRNKQQEAILRDGIRKINKDNIDKQREEQKKFKAAFRDSIVAQDTSNLQVGFFVKENEQIEPRHLSAIASGINNFNAVFYPKPSSEDPQNPTPPPTKKVDGAPLNLYFTEADIVLLTPYLDGDYYKNVPEDVISPILARSEKFNGFNTVLYSENPILKYCREKTFDEKCATEHVDNTVTHEEGALPPNAIGENVEVVNIGDIPRYIARLISKMPSPENAFTGTDGIVDRPDLKQVQNGVNNFRLEKGPADVTSFHDFQSLQIAFDHVWQQLLDSGLIRCAGKLYSAMNHKGVNLPDEHLNYVMAAARDEISAANDPKVNFPPPDILTYFDITAYEWSDLSEEYREKLSSLSVLIKYAEKALGSPPIAKTYSFDTSSELMDTIQNIKGLFLKDDDGKKHIEELGKGKIMFQGMDVYSLASMIQNLKEQGERIIEFSRDETYTSAHKILQELEERLRSNYAFSIFAADKNYHSVNFGLLNTFRQKWEPVAYQVGQLVKTMPLSPKEERKYSLKITTNKKRVEKESQKNNQSSQTEQTSTSRAEAEIIKKANLKTNFDLSTTGSFDLGIYKGDGTSTFGINSEEDSQRTKKDFREAVLKAVQEYKEERSTEIDTEESYGSEYTESGTIVNPNDELAVTYLFYELQRRYRISEQIHRVAPVVLVAQEVPNPDEINESWVVAHDWILNRFLLDDSFRPALQYISAKNVGDDYSVRELRKNLRQQRQLVETLKLELTMNRREVDNRYSALEQAVNDRINEAHTERNTGFFQDLRQKIVGNTLGLNGEEDPEAAQAVEQATRDAHRVAVERAEKAAQSLQQEVASLHKLTNDFNRTMRDHLDKKAMVKRLLVHIKNNILYYMQAIWTMEPPDQRYFRLYNVRVPQFESTGKTYKIAVEPTPDIFAQFRPEGTTRHKAFVKASIKGGRLHSKPLVEVADLDSPMGFKGNYMIFPLKEHNTLTEMMAMPFIDSAFGAMDPDQLSNINLDEYAKYVCCLHDNLPTAEYEKLKPMLKQWLQELLADPLRNGDEIIVPSGSLYIEVLASGHNLLEGFKQRHRVLDVQKVQAEVRGMELENIRYAARLLADEREDPRIEKKIVVEGNGVNVNLDNA